MASPAAQAKAQALNAKLEGEARVVIDSIDKQYMRKIARETHQCALKCYDQAGNSGSSEALDNCVRNCQLPHQQANAYVQNVSQRDGSEFVGCQIFCCYHDHASTTF